MPRKYIAPTVSRSFNCPHCGAPADQKWFKVHAYSYNDDELPWWEVKPDIVKIILTDRDFDEDQKKELVEYYGKISSR